MEVNAHLPREGMLRSRRQLYALVIFAGLVLLVMAVFGWLLYRSLAERDLVALDQDVTRKAQRVANYIEEEVAKNPKRGLLLTLTTSRTVLPVLETVLLEHQAVQAVEVFDADGFKIYTAPSGWQQPDLDEVEVSDLLEQNVVRVAVGELGSLAAHLDPREGPRLVAAVRTSVVGRATSMLAFILALFGIASWIVWRNFAASREELEQVAHTERMAYIGTLAAGLAHEIRSPLNSLSLNMQMLDEEIARVNPQGSGRRLLEITSAEIDRLEGLVTEFLSYARPRPMAMEHQKAVDLVKRVVDVVGGGLEASGVEVRIEDQSEGADVFVDPDQIHQMLLNLTQNATYATERLQRPAWIEFVIEHDEDAVRIKVLDNGRGMSEEDLEQATQIFYSRRKGGTGLGLAIVERVVRSHGGGLNLDSELGVGTTVTVELPAYVPSSGVQKLMNRSRLTDDAPKPGQSRFGRD